MLVVVLEPDATPADHLFDVGRILKNAEWCTCSECQRYKANNGYFAQLARRFYQMNRGLILRAMVEGWSIERIEQEVNRQSDTATG